MSTRTDQVARVAGLLGGRSNVAIHGAPGTGKTWLADSVVDSLRESEVQILRVDLSISHSGAEVFNELLATSEGERPSEDEDGVSVFGAWRRLREALVAAGRPTIIVMDEFDAVVRYADSVDFLRLSRELVHRPSATTCVGLFVSRRSLESVEEIVRGISTLATLCYQEYMRPVSADDIRSSFPLAAALSEEECLHCLNWSNGHPALVRYWLSVRPDCVGNPDGVSQKILAMDRLVDYLDALRLVDAAAQLVIGPVVDDWIRERGQLDELGVLRVDGLSIGVSYSDCAVFVDLLRRRTWDLNPWGILGRAEVQLRGLIEQIQVEHDGEGWAERSQQRAICAVYDRSVAMRDDDIRRLGRGASWLAYTYPGDLWNIISVNWSRFCEVFSRGDKQYWRERFEGMARYRTPMAHNRFETVTREDRALCRMYADDIIRAIGDWREG
ncbi:ATP-binding protein [Mumia sp. Pv 4-285]|uniref:ATP-binding protein n=1 Tax=Mumia qirimensis TaxID=3234852 RepID=UPI00351D13F1